MNVCMNVGTMNVYMNVGIKLQVSSAEYHFFYRALLQERPIILRSLLIVSKHINQYGVAMIRKLLENTGLFCRI